VEYHPVSTSRMLNPVKGMPFAWSLNPYRGCRHACLYCYARIYHTYIGFEDPADFDRVVLAKGDLASKLERELRAMRRRLSGEVAIGTATDPYQPIEARERITRGALEVLLRHGAGVSITTKSPLVTRDLDLLAAFAGYGGIRVNMTVTVLDEGLWRVLEPGTPRPDGRLAAVGRLRKAGVPASVFLAPVVPFVGEREALRVLERAREEGADHVMTGVLRLSPGVREWLFPRLERALPGSFRLVEALYGDRQRPRAAERRAIMGPILRRRHELGLDREISPPKGREYQMTLFA